MSKPEKLSVMIAGIGGASLGTELLKSLVLTDRYQVFGCDVSSTAYGLYDSRFAGTFLVDRADYVVSVIDACKTSGASWLLPGGEQPMVLLSGAAKEVEEAGIRLIGNDPEIVKLFSDKATTFERLGSLGFPVPRTAEVFSTRDLERVELPCIIKPSTGSGGSAMVFYAVEMEEAMGYVNYIRHAGGTPLAQEYVDVAEGEFTIGVLSLPDQQVIGSIALRRSLDAKLSVITRGRGGVVSSGYSQGYIADYPEIRDQAEAVAKAVGSRGPLNIQGRLRGGVLIPFEINPRLSASTYLRAMAGFNEADLLLRALAFNESVLPDPLREGWYLRSLTELHVPPGKAKS